MDGPAKKPKIFLSYSRKDRETVARLSDALEAKGFDVFRDTEDILPTEEWKGRLESLIAAADTVVFALSPASAASAVCAWEADHAGTLNKRIAPIVISDVEGQAIPPSLSKLNYIFMTGRDDFDRALANLVTSLNTDIGWIREHTRLGELARRWQDASKPDRALLRGEDIAEAERWRDRRPTEAPALTELHLDYISGSRHAATRGQRRTIGIALGVAALSMVLAGFAYLQRNTAVAERNQALTTQSRFLSDLSVQQQRRHDYTTATLLALDGLPDEDSRESLQRNRPRVVDAITALSNSATQLREIALFEHGTGGDFVTFSADGKLLVTAHRHAISNNDYSVVLRDAATGKELRRFDKASGQLWRAAFSPDGKRLVTSVNTGTATLWDVATGRKIGDLKGDGDAMELLAFSPDGTRLIVGAGGWSGRSVRLWNAVSAEPVGAPIVGAQSAAFAAGGQVVLSIGGGGTVMSGYDGKQVEAQSALWNAADGSLISDFSAGGGRRTRAVLSPDGAQVLTLGYRSDAADASNKIAAIWDARTGSKITDVQQPVDFERAVFSPDAKRVAVLANDKTVVVWDTATGATLVAPEEKDVVAITFAPDGSSLAVAVGRRVTFWSSETGQQNADPLFADTDISSLSFHPDGKALLATSLEALHHWTWPERSASPLSRPPGTSQPALTPNWKIVAVPQGGNAVKLVRLAGGEEFATIGQHSSTDRVMFDPGGERLVSVSNDGTAQLWTLVARGLAGVFKGESFFASKFALTPDGSRLFATTDEDGSQRQSKPKTEFARIWDTRSGGPLLSFAADGGKIWDAVISPDGARVATAENEAAKIWDIANGSEQRVFAVPGDEVRRVAFSPSGGQLLTTSGQGTTTLWDAITGARMFSLEGQIVDSAQTPFSPDGRSIMTWQPGDKAVSIWDAAMGQKIVTLAERHSDVLHSLSFSPDGKSVVTASKDKTARVYDVGTARQRLLLSGHDGEVRSAVFSPDGTRLLTASDDGTARVWDAKTGDILLTLADHANAQVGSALYSPDGRTIATIAKDVRLWDAAAGALLAVYTGHTGWIRELAFSRDGGVLVTSAMDKTIRIWPVATSPQAMMRQAKSSVSRCLAVGEREQNFLPPDPPRWCIVERKPPYDSDAWQEWLAARDRGAEIKMPTVRW